MQHYVQDLSKNLWILRNAEFNQHQSMLSSNNIFLIYGTGVFKYETESSAHVDRCTMVATFPMFRHYRCFYDHCIFEHPYNQFEYIIMQRQCIFLFDEKTNEINILKLNYDSYVDGIVIHPDAEPTRFPVMHARCLAFKEFIASLVIYSELLCNLIILTIVVVVM